MNKPAYNQKGSMAIYVTLILVVLSTNFVPWWLSRRSFQQVAQQTEQLNRDIDLEFAIIGHFLGTTANCLKNFSGDYSSRKITVNQLRRSDDSSFLETTASSADTAYLDGRVQVQDITLSGFVADPPGGLSGRAQLTLSFLSLRQKLGSPLVQRTLPIDLTMDASNNITSCFNASTLMDGFWRTDNNGAYYTGGNVGINNSTPNYPLDVGGGQQGLIPDCVVNTIFGSQDQGGTSFCNDAAGPIGTISIPSGHSFLFSNDLAKDPVILNPTIGTLTANYPPGAVAPDHLLQLRSTDGTPYISFRSDTNGAQPKWLVGPRAGGVVTGHLVFSSPGNANASAFINHPAGGQVDVRVGLDESRPGCANCHFYVFGNAGGSETWVSTSDARLKKDIKVISGALAQVSRLNGYFFKWIDPKLGTKREMGLIAQDLLEQKVAEELVDCSGSTCMLQYAPLTALLTEAVKELDQKQTSLEKRIEKIKNTLASRKIK